MVHPPHSVDMEQYTVAEMSIQCNTIPFPNLEGDAYKKLWATYLPRPDSRTFDRVASSEPLLGHISLPLMYVSGVSNDFSTATGQWNLCETQDPDLRRKQLKLVGKLLSDDQSMSMRSNSSVDLAAAYQSCIAGFEQKRVLLALDASTVSIESTPSKTAPRSDSALILRCTVTRDFATDGKSKDCNRAHTFDSFVDRKQLGNEEQPSKVKARHRDSLRRWIRVYAKALHPVRRYRKPKSDSGSEELVLVAA
ncbi:hypothetical protein CFE70_003548 [Pyrenophora teres f. teres 0-1]|nr:hypothetical protein HRS9122_00699 [Pyrenophora teres f. teres]